MLLVIKNSTQLCLRTLVFSIVLMHSNYNNRIISIVSLFWDTLYVKLSVSQTFALSFLIKDPNFLIRHMKTFFLHFQNVARILTRDELHRELIFGMNERCKHIIVHTKNVQNKV